MYGAMSGFGCCRCFLLLAACASQGAGLDHAFGRQQGVHAPLNDMATGANAGWDVSSALRLHRQHKVGTRHRAQSSDAASVVHDVVIMVGPSEVPLACIVLRALRRHVKGARRIVALSPKDPLTPSLRAEGFEWVADDVVLNYLKKQRGFLSVWPNLRAMPWLLQQEIKLAAPLAIPGLLPQVMLSDGDVIWRRDVHMFEKNGAGDIRALINRGKHRFDRKAATYKAFVEQMVPGVKKPHGKTVIAHHMPVQRDILQALFTAVERAHASRYASFWEAMYRVSDGITAAWINKNPDEAMAYGRSMTEYELYGRFAEQRFASRTRIRGGRQGIADDHLKYNDFCGRDSGKVAYNTCHHHAVDRPQWLPRQPKCA